MACRSGSRFRAGGGPPSRAGLTLASTRREGYLRGRASPCSRGPVRSPGRALAPRLAARAEQDQPGSDNEQRDRRRLARPPEMLEPCQVVSETREDEVEHTEHDHPCPDGAHATAQVSRTAVP